MTEEMFQRKEPSRDEPVREANALGIGMHRACNDEANMQAILNGLEALLHEQLADLQPAIVRMNGEAAKLSYEIGMGPKIEEDGGRADDTAHLGVFRN